MARNLLSQLWSRVISNIGVRLLQVPLLLSALGQEDYGRWMVISIFPAWLTLLNMGAGTVAGNSMVMAVAAGDMSVARKTYADAMSVAIRIVCLLLPIVSILAFVVPMDTFLGIPEHRSGEASLGLLFLCLSVLGSFIADVHATRLRAAGKADVAAYLLGGQAWVELAAIGTLLAFAPRFDLLGAANLFSTLAYAATVWVVSRRALPEIRFDARLSDSSARWALLRSGGYYQALPLGHALLLQGQVIVVHQWLGAGSVAVFSTARTLVRLVSQGLEMVNHSVWPELSRLFGRGDLLGAARLHRTAVFTALTISITLSVFLFVSGPWLYAIWTHQLLTVDASLLLALLASVPTGAVWYTSSMVPLSCNAYEGLALRFLIAALVSHVGCWGLCAVFGLRGAALSTLLADIIMMPYVFRLSLSLTGDRLSGFSTRLLSDIRSR